MEVENGGHGKTKEGHVAGVLASFCFHCLLLLDHGQSRIVAFRWLRTTWFCGVKTGCPLPSSFFGGVLQYLLAFPPRKSTSFSNPLKHFF